MKYNRYNNNPAFNPGPQYFTNQPMNLVHWPLNTIVEAARISLTTIKFIRIT